MILPPDRTDENGLECNRCGMRVNYPTKHAWLVHGDQGVLLPVAHGKADQTDAAGRIRA